MSDRPAVLFVCLGNICRSPLAEAAFRAEIGRRGLDIETDSAGTGDWHVGEAPDPRAQAVARRHGAEIGHYQARQVREADFDRFSHVLAMDHDNLRRLQTLHAPGARATLGLLLDYVPGRTGQAVADPYYGADDGFEETWSEVNLAARRLADELATWTDPRAHSGESTG